MIKSTFKAICWDHDGLLVDTERLFFEATREVFAEAGVLLPVELWTMEYLSKGVGTESISLRLGLTKSQTDEVIRERNQRYRARLELSPPLRPNVMGVLESLRGVLPLALVTGSPREQVFAVHRKTHLLDCFSAIIAREDYERAKPEPDSYLEAVRQLGVFPHDCFAVEDSKRGLSAAISAGMKCIVVPNSLTSGQDFALAYSIEADLTAILSHICPSHKTAMHAVAGSITSDGQSETFHG